MKLLLNNKNFRHLWLAQILSQIAINMMVFVLAIRVYQETLSNTAVSFTFLSIGLPALLLGIPAGVAADYLDRRFILIAANLGRAFLLLLFFFASNQVFIIYGLAFIISSITQLFVPAEGSLMADLVQKDDLLEANSFFTLSFYSSLAFGFIMAGPALTLMGKENIFFLLSFLLFVSSYFVFLLPDKKMTKVVIIWVNFLGKIQKLVQSIIRSFGFIASRKKTFQAILLIALVQVIAAVFSALVPGFSDTILRIKVEDASFMVFGPTIGGVLFGSVLVNFLDKKRLEAKRTTRLLLFSISAILILLPLSSLFFGLFLLFALGILQAFLLIPSYAFIQKNVDSGFRGRAYGLLTSFIGGASILPSLISGLLADVFGVRLTLQFLAVIIAVIAFFNKKRILRKL